ncbi:MAG TPA: glycerol-3-phosphate acyltransferase, partial [Kamptonema sp.]|nr:glycerol-3-phosphate acyltransferase [Kamptonema sp.]
MSVVVIGFAIAASFCLGSLPLTGWAVQLFAGKDLRQLGTGNTSVSAAFIYGGKFAGIAAVLGEIARGIVPVLAAKAWFADTPSIAIATLIALVAGRYFIANGGGVTNATWGIFAYAPPVALASGITGLVIWGLGEWLQPGAKSRLRAVRWGCLSGSLWIWIWHRSPVEFLTTAGLVILLVAINLHQADDMALDKTQLFSLTDKLDAKICGEKAARLAQLKRAGFNVPPGWILPPLKAVVSNLGERQQAKKILAALFNGSSDNLSLNPIIVRSSAIGEDSDTNSAAGQYQTIKSIATEAELAEAINRCRQSYWSAEAVAYRHQRQLPDTGMAVLVQPYINSQFAGVMFSRNPLDGGSQVIIEALPGGAEAVVGGQSTPIHLEIDFLQQEPPSPPYEEDLVGVVPPRLPPTFLPNNIIVELVKQAQAIEAFFHGLPQDIEWSWDGEKLWILQSRPITNLRPIWTRTIAAEVIPGAIHPLTWSINRPLTCGVWGEIFKVVLGEKAADLDFKETATLLGSHAYFNATLLGEIFRMMGLPEQGLEFLLRGKKMGKPPLMRVLPSLPGLWRLVQRERALDEEFRRDRAAIFLPALEQLEQEKERKSLLELLEKAEQIQAWLKPITYYNILGPIGLAIRRSLWRVPDEWLSNETAPEIASLRALQQLANRLEQVTKLQFQNNISSTQIEEVFANDAGVQTDFKQWLNTYGYLSEVGTDIAVPTWQEQPDTFRRLLITMTYKSAIDKSQESRSEILKEASRSQPQNLIQHWRLAQCQKRAIVKTQIAEIYNRLLAHLRWTFLAIEACGLEENVLEESGDIFYLEFVEIQHWIRGSGKITFKDIIKQRREHLKRDRDRTIPPLVYGNLPPKPNLKAETVITGNTN